MIRAREGMQAHRAELERVSSAADFERQQDYLETVGTIRSAGV